MTRKPEFRERPADWPSSNRGWRLGVAFGAVAVLLVVGWLTLATLTEVLNV